MTTTVTAGQTSSFQIGPFDTLTMQSSNGTGPIVLTSQSPKLVADQTLAVQNGTFGPFGAPMACVMVVSAGSVGYDVNVRSLTTDQSRSTVLSAQTTRLPRWLAAVAAMKAGTRNAKLLIVGDSVAVGLWSAGVGFPNAKATGWPVKLAALFNAAGVRTNNAAVFGDCSNSSVAATLMSVDPRLSLGTNWLCNSLYAYGGFTVVNSTAGSQTLYSFTPAETFDTIEVTYVTHPLPYGKFVISVDGGAAIGAVVDCNATLSVQQTTRTCARGTHRIDIARSAPSGADGPISIISVRAWDSTIKTVDFLNASVGGTTTTLQSDTTAAYKALSVGPIYAPDLTIICLDINDWATGVVSGLYDQVTTTTHSYQLQKIITAYRATGDVILMTGCPSLTSSYSQAVQDGILYATRELAVLNGIPLVDSYAALGNYATALAAGYYAPGGDSVHPGITGHVEIAARVASVPGIFGAV